jgi:riboflavin synthase
VSNEDDGSYRYEFDLSNDWGRYICEKGSIAIDGISLTVASVTSNKFSVAIIPHTWEATNLSQKTKGDIVNIEVDILAKYIERQLTHYNKEANLNA